jgi:4-amino-4-deoxy-L-arabinose transferase-like glycosyltransferase
MSENTEDRSQESEVRKFIFWIWQPIAVAVSVKSWYFWIITFLFLLLIPYPLFHGLDALTLRIYDDARRGVNAFEMLHNGNFLVTYYNGEPDLWGTKPPLLVWLQTAFMLILGPGELAVRLPSAISSLLTCLVLVLFSVKYLRNPWFGLIWAVILVTFNGYLDFHGTRTGDFDAMLTLFMMLYALCFFIYTENKNPKFLIYTAIFITLAVMTKGVAGLLFMPTLLIWALIIKCSKDIWRSRKTWIGLGIFILIVGGYYISREAMNPGYLRTVSDNELGGRYFQSIEGHSNQAIYYIDHFIYPRLQKWAIFIIPGMLAGFFLKEKMAKNLHLFSIFLIITHLLIISFSGTKLPWYDLPEFPFIALVIANFIWAVALLLLNFVRSFNKSIALFIPLIFILLIFYEPLRKTFKEATTIVELPYNMPDQEIAIFLREGVRESRNLDSSVLVHENYDAQCLFYLYLLKDKGQKVVRKTKEQLAPGDKVIAHQESVKEFIEGHYQTDVLESKKFVRVYSIH